MKLKKRLKTLLMFLLIIPVCVCFSACSAKNLSAYEIAVKNGFNGTEIEWLESLRGKSAYELAVENGFKGTEIEWLESLQGKNGEDGKPATNVDTYELYEAAKEKGEIPEDYTYLNFIRDYFGTTGTYSSVVANKNLMSVVSVSAYTSKNSNNSIGNGSGVILSIDEAGNAYVVTNYHVTTSSSGYSYPYYKLHLFGEDFSISAEFVGSSRTYDLAILKVSANEICYGETLSAGEILKSSNAQACKMRDEAVFLGETIYAIGDTKSSGITLTKGIVSVENEIIKMTLSNRTGYYREIRHDAYIYHGNSGGGLFDANGNLVGVTNGGVENTSMNYAIPIDVVKPVCEKIIEAYENGGTQARVASLGIENFAEYYSENNLEAKDVLTIYDSLAGRVQTKEKVTISKIDAGSRFDGIFKSNDVITMIEYNGVVYDDVKSHTLKTLLISSKTGDTIKITVSRKDGDEETKLAKTITLTELDFVDLV